MEFILANKKRVTADQDEIRKIITKAVIPNPYWRYSGLLREEEVMTFLQGESGAGALKRVAYYILVVGENTAFSAYLFSKAEGTDQESLDFNLHALENLRNLHEAVKESGNEKRIKGLVHEMERLAMGVGVDPF